MLWAQHRSTFHCSEIFQARSLVSCSLSEITQQKNAHSTFQTQAGAKLDGFRFVILLFLQSLTRFGSRDREENRATNKPWMMVLFLNECYIQSTHHSFFLLCLRERFSVFLRTIILFDKFGLPLPYFVHDIYLFSRWIFFFILYNM